MKAAKVERKIRGIFQRPPGSGIWRISYQMDGVRKIEKVGRKGDALDLYRIRKTELRTQEKLPQNLRYKGITFEKIATDALAYSAKHHKDIRNIRQRLTSINVAFGGRVAASIKPSEIDLFACAASIDFHMPDLARLPAGNRGEALIAHILEQWEGEATGAELKVLLRAAGTHELARRRFVEVVQEQSLPIIQKITAEDRQEERISLILMQIAGLVVSRYLLAYSAAVSMPRDRVVRILGPIVQQYLSGTML